MREFLDQLQELRSSEQHIVAATLIATSGPSPRRVGARLWVGGSGRSVGSVSVGGCIDSRVMEAVPDVIRSATARVVSVDMGDPSLDLGFTCAGQLDVLLEPIDMTNSDDPFLRAYSSAARTIAHQGRAVRFRRIDGNGQLVVGSDGSSTGSLGSTELDEAARNTANFETGSGMVSVADTDVFMEVLRPAPRLLVLGAGPVAPPLLKLAGALGWDTVVVDSRPNAPIEGAGEVISGNPAAYAESLANVSNTAVVLLAHDYKFDLPVLRAVLNTDVPYIGMLGSRRRGKALLEFLADEGIAKEQLQRIRVPVGLDIGADSPAELALSVLAEAMAALRNRTGGSMSTSK